MNAAHLPFFQCEGKQMHCFEHPGTEMMCCIFSSEELFSLIFVNQVSPPFSSKKRKTKAAVAACHAMQSCDEACGLLNQTTTKWLKRMRSKAFRNGISQFASVLNSFSKDNRR